MFIYLFYLFIYLNLKREFKKPQHILQRCKMAFFSTIWLISPKNYGYLHESFIRDVSLDKDIPIKFRNHSDF